MPFQCWNVKFDRKRWYPPIAVSSFPVNWLPPILLKNIDILPDPAKGGGACGTSKTYLG